MFVKSTGRGVPAVVFVHRFACDHTEWAAQLAELAATRAVLACDLRGHGRSPGTPADCTIATLGADVARIVARAKRLASDIGAALFTDMVRWDAARMDAALAAVNVSLMVIQSTAMRGGKRVSLAAGESSPWLELVRGRVPDARIEIVSGVGHFSQIAAAVQVNALLTDFVGSLAQRRTGDA